MAALGLESPTLGLWPINRTHPYVNGCTEPPEEYELLFPRPQTLRSECGFSPVGENLEAGIIRYVCSLSGIIRHVCSLSPGWERLRLSPSTLQTLHPHPHTQPALSPKQAPRKHALPGDEEKVSRFSVYPPRLRLGHSPAQTLH